MRKIAAHYIYPINGDPVKYGVLTVDDNGTILELSQSNDNLQETASVEFYNGIIVPGFVNAHCHLELSHMKGFLPQGGGMGAFCEGITQNRNNYTIEEQQQFMANVDKQMYNEGVVAVGDISNRSTSFKVKQKSPVYYHTFVECLGLDTDKTDSILNYAKALKTEAEELGLSASITPHAPYSMSEKLFAESVRLACEDGILSIHNQESRDEMELFAKGTSNLRVVFEKAGFKFDEAILNYKNPIARILKYVDKTTHLLLIHNVYTTEEDVEFVTTMNQNTTFVLCPNSNLYIEDILPPVNTFYNNKVNIAIGTDSLSSNINISILDELKTLNIHFPQISLNDLLCWATLGGAKALMKDTELGSFDKGKCPGVVLIENVDFDNLQLTPLSHSTRLI